MTLGCADPVGRGAAGAGQRAARHGDRDLATIFRAEMWISLRLQRIADLGDDPIDRGVGRGGAEQGRPVDFRRHRPIAACADHEPRGAHPRAVEAHSGDGHRHRESTALAGIFMEARLLLRPRYRQIDLGQDLVGLERRREDALEKIVSLDLAVTATETEDFPVMRALRDVELTEADMAFVNG